MRYAPRIIRAGQIESRTGAIQCFFDSKTIVSPATRLSAIPMGHLGVTPPPQPGRSMCATPLEG